MRTNTFTQKIRQVLLIMGIVIKLIIHQIIYVQILEKKIKLKSQIF